MFLSLFFLEKKKSFLCPALLIPIGHSHSILWHRPRITSQKFNMCDFVAKAGIACEHWCPIIERHRAPLYVLLTHVWKPAFMLGSHLSVSGIAYASVCLTPLFAKKQLTYFRLPAVNGIANFFVKIYPKSASLYMLFTSIYMVCPFNVKYYSSLMPSVGSVEQTFENLLDVRFFLLALADLGQILR